MSSIEDLLSKLAMTTVTTVSRIALSHATNAAIRNVTTFVTQQSKASTTSTASTKELQWLQRQLDLKAKNLKPAIDIIAQSVGDGNNDLEPALEMCNDLKRDIDEFTEEMHQELEKKSTTGDYVKVRLKRLLSHIDDVVPSLHLALRTLEVTSDRPHVSRSRLVQASALLQESKQKKNAHTFCLSLYSLFAANIRNEGQHNFTWKEEFHKCHLKLNKTDTRYVLHITEDLNDGRYHEELDQGKSKGQSLMLDVGLVKRMYYTRSGELLNIEDAKTPVLVLKLLKQESEERSADDKPTATKEAKPEIDDEELAKASWYALALYPSQEQDPENDDEDDSDDKSSTATPRQKDDTPTPSQSPTTADSLSHLNMSLLLLESVIKLSILEKTEHMDHLCASDELIDLYMA